MYDIIQDVSFLSATCPHIAEYNTRSLYFDNCRSSISPKERFLLRYDNGDTAHVYLEKITKVENVRIRESVELAADQCEALMTARYDRLGEPASPLIMEIYINMRYTKLRPGSIVDCHRKEFAMPGINAHVTVDSDIRVSKSVLGFLIPNLATVPVANKTARQIIYEIPADIHNAVERCYKCTA